MVCPNRLFAIDSVDPTELRSYSDLSEAVRFVLEALGATPDQVGYPIGAWSEITITDRQNLKTFSYRFDFILNPVEEMTADAFVQEWDADLVRTRRIFGTERGLFAPKRVPGYPMIVEVMTASTSGSSERHERGIAPAFYSAWATALHGEIQKSDAPGPNTRQVWGRMASQLIAKSEAGEYWGGRTVWIMQDKLLRYIQDTTHISRSFDASQVSLPLPLKGANIVSFKFGPLPAPGVTRPIQLDRYIGDDIPDMFNALGEPTMHGILHAPFVPSPATMALKLLEGQQETPARLKVIILP